MPTTGAKAATAWSIIVSARHRSSGRCRWRAAPTRRELSLDFDHGLGLGELGAQALVLPAQASVLALHRVGRRASHGLGQGLEGAAVALLAPVGDEGGGEALAPQQRALALPVEDFVLGQDPRFVRRRVAPLGGPLGDLGVGVAHATSIGGGHRHQEDSFPTLSGSVIRGCACLTGG